MSKYLYAILALFLLVACTQPTDSSADEEAGTPQEFVPEGGTPLSHFVDMPGVTWSFDTIYGVCGPDTLVLWMSYRGNDFLTNVRGFENGDFPLLTVKGRKRLEKNMNKPSFLKSDFTEAATLTFYQNLTRPRFLALRDTAYTQAVEEMRQMVEDFYYSLGDPKYMAPNLAANWRVIVAQSEAEGAYSPNPFNGAPYIEFDEGSVMVQVPDPKAGIVEVSAYCLDPFTLGVPGWAYWTVKVGRQNGQFKIKESPARHRKFTTG